MTVPAPIRYPLLLVFLLIASLRASGPLDGYHEAAISTGQLFWKSWPVEDLQSVESMLPAALARAEARLGRQLGRAFSTALVPDGFELRRVVARIAGGAPDDRSVLGVAIPSAMFLVIRGDFASSLEPLSVTVEHEVAHLVIHRSPGVRIPRWLDEGVAMWASQASIPADAEAYLAFLARVGGLYRLDSLEHQFPSAHELSSIAYQQSFLFIEYLVSRHGRPVVAALLDQLEGGVGSETALRAVSGLERPALEEQFQTWVASRRSLASAVASITSLWTLASLLALLAIARYWLRRRRRFASMAAEEEGLEDPVEGTEEGEEPPRDA